MARASLVLDRAGTMHQQNCAVTTVESARGRDEGAVRENEEGVTTLPARPAGPPTGRGFEAACLVVDGGRRVPERRGVVVPRRRRLPPVEHVRTMRRPRARPVVKQASRPESPL